MSQYEEADVTVVSGKGQVVIPQAIREKLGIGPKTKLLVYGYDDAVIMKKMEIPDVIKDLKRIYREVDKKVKKYGSLSDKEINEIVQQSRRKRRASRMP
ncbi:AbrB/MazE/SpoVT family DNA-binding domain-containing protein [Nitrososphaera sp.]|uniref:AbrB/MazE/SpoVT family DNA-binding domain-containing protein n=1 Tax=Nitrososphaera sp. TaxID=1971748 RepID=UPI00178FB05F|nr:AbrB/MazE/SpoVT family DNA-binding domain-containing protein [Nitrososphaera sp.]NWG36564.1 AbrB/MazE/SpoVT family DNA-binding domain-containing protein [Nitrososphaera sp.]